MAKGKLSAGDCVVKALKRHWPDYEKRCDGAWMKLRDRLPTAMKNARKAREEAAATGDLNPSTSVDCLVEALQTLRS